MVRQKASRKNPQSIHIEVRKLGVIKKEAARRI
jgi:hypothetical protein